MGFLLWYGANIMQMVNRYFDSEFKTSIGTKNGMESGHTGTSQFNKYRKNEECEIESEFVNNFVSAPI